VLSTSREHQSRAQRYCCAGSLTRLYPICSSACTQLTAILC